MQEKRKIVRGLEAAWGGALSLFGNYFCEGDAFIEEMAYRTKLL
jgi:hypothetical protein